MLEQRIRLRFQKQGEVKFISHHDLMRLFERVIRRANIPIKMTSGFNPRPKISFPLSLSVGTEGKNEIVELGLDRWMSVFEVRKRLQDKLPDGIDIVSAELIPPKKNYRVSETVYEVYIEQSRRPNNDQVRELLDRRHIFVERIRKGRKKQVDVRPYLSDIRLEKFGLTLVFRVTPQGTGKPEEILGELGIDDVQRHRVTAVSAVGMESNSHHLVSPKLCGEGQIRVVRTQVNLTISERK